MSSIERRPVPPWWVVLAALATLAMALLVVGVFRSLAGGGSALPEPSPGPAPTPRPGPTSSARSSPSVRPEPGPEPSPPASGRPRPRASPPGDERQALARQLEDRDLSASSHGSGRSRPLPSIVVPRPSLWELLVPRWLVLASTLVLLAALAARLFDRIGRRRGPRP